LLGFRFKNTTGMSLMQGPVTVFEGGVYAGDARVPDMQPDEERLIGYALDPGVEVKAQNATYPDELAAVQIVRGLVEMQQKKRIRGDYLIRNRSKKDRVVIVEHPIRDGWELAGEARPTEQSRSHYRFEVKVPAGQSVLHEVVEQQSEKQTVALKQLDETTVKWVLGFASVSASIKEVLGKELTQRVQLEALRQELAGLNEKLKGLVEEQHRLAQTLDRLPPDSAVRKRFLEKFDAQETELEKLQVQLRECKERERIEMKARADYLDTLTVK
jgi:hypothetical protein